MPFTPVPTTERTIHPCTDRNHGDPRGQYALVPVATNPHTHGSAGWGNPLDTVPVGVTRMQEDGRDMLFSTDPTLVTTPPVPPVHLCEIPGHTARRHRHSRYNTDPLDRVRMDGSLGDPVRWPGMPRDVHLVVDCEEDGSEKQFSCDPALVTAPSHSVRIAEATPVYVVEPCERGHHPRGRHHHTCPPDRPDFGFYWREEGRAPRPGHEDALVETHPNGPSRVYARDAAFVGQPITEDGGPCE